MDKTQTSPSRENYEELDGLTAEEIEKRAVYCKDLTSKEFINKARHMFDKIMDRVN